MLEGPDVSSLSACPSSFLSFNASLPRRELRSTCSTLLQPKFLLQVLLGVHAPMSKKYSIVLMDTVYSHSMSTSGKESSWFTPSTIRSIIIYSIALDCFQGYEGIMSGTCPGVGLNTSTVQ